MNAVTFEPEDQAFLEFNHIPDETEKKAKDLLHAIDESSIVAFADLSGRINYVNNKFCEISGYGRDELLGRQHSIINSGYHSKEFFVDLWKTIRLGRIWKGEIKNKAKDGSFYWVFTTIVPILNEDGRPREYLSIRYDVTEKKRLEEENIKNIQEILETKINQETSERFVSSLTHDMRTPLTAAKLSAQMILRNSDNKESIKKYASVIVSNLNRADDMIVDLLNATKIRAGQKLDVPMELCDAIDIAKKSIEELVTIYGKRFDLYTYGNGFGVWSSSGIKRILENLCINAIKYGDTNKQIGIAIIVDEKELKIEVQNWGEVIKKEEASSLFDYLQRTVSAQKSRKTGWGIGLTLVKGMAESHNGSVEVTSSIERGTIFTVKLPKQVKSDEI